MSLTRTQVEGIAHLARLEITEAQMPVYVESLSRIIDFVEQLAAADTADEASSDGHENGGETSSEQDELQEVPGA